MSEYAITVENVGKKFFLGIEKAGSLREVLATLFSPTGGSREEFWALRDINFEVKQGDVVGIIGRNGSGKSTLLKILSRITPPTTGNVAYRGRISSLLEVGTGFHPELTGRENIFLNGTILGMTRNEIKNKFDQIVDFSGIEKFIDTAVKHYSSGMYVRLAFAVAAHLDPEILIVDEVLAVGDADFQRKCLGKMKDVSTNEGRTVLFVSHNMAAVTSLCKKGLLLKQGVLQTFGDINEVVHEYNTMSLQKHDTLELNLSNHIRERGKLDIMIQRIRFNSVMFKPSSEFILEIFLKANVKGKYKAVNLAFHIMDEYETQIYHVSNVFIDKPNLPYTEKQPYIFKIPELRLRPGTYKLWLWLQANGIEQDYISEGLNFEVTSGNAYAAVFNATIVGCVQPPFELHYGSEH